MKTCTVCGVRPRAGLSMCKACGRAFDRMIRGSRGELIEVIDWAATRARVKK